MKKEIIMPKTDEAPVSVTEKLVREDIRKLTQNAEEIRKLKEQVEKAILRDKTLGERAWKRFGEDLLERELKKYGK